VRRGCLAAKRQGTCASANGDRRLRARGSTSTRARCRAVFRSLRRSSDGRTGDHSDDVRGLRRRRKRIRQTPPRTVRWGRANARAPPRLVSPTCTARRRAQSSDTRRFASREVTTRPIGQRDEGTCPRPTDGTRIWSARPEDERGHEHPLRRNARAGTVRHVLRVHDEYSAPRRGVRKRARAPMQGRAV